MVIVKRLNTHSRLLQLKCNGVINISFSYSVGQYDDGFIFNLQVDICIPIDGDCFCIPDDGLKLLEDEKFPACSIAGLMNLTSKRLLNLPQTRF